MESREWCTQAVRRARAEDEALQRAELQPQLQQPESEPDGVMERAQGRALLRWAKQLQAEGDEAALALADFLLSAAPLEQADARERLLARAQRSSQGLVISLAIQRCQGDDACWSRLGRRWAQQEPDNAAAWLYSGGALSPAEVLSGLQGAAHIQDYQLPVASRVLALAQAPSAGLRDAAELQVLRDLSGGWSLPRWSALIKHCQAVPQPAECAGSADRLWRLEDPQLLNRMLTVKLAGEHGRRAPEWRARAAEAEAVVQWSAERVEVETQAWRVVDACDPSQDLGTQLRKQLGQGEWPRIAAEMRAHRQNEAELAARRRQRSGRSLLDPPKP